MAAELTSTKLNAENHLLLVSHHIPTPLHVHHLDTNTVFAWQDQPLLRLPHELARRNLKSIQRVVEREKECVLPSLKDAAKAAMSNHQKPDQTLATLDAMISRMQGLKRKMENLHQEEKKVHLQSRKRIQHLDQLYHIPSLTDVKYDQWSRVRLDRLVIDHMLRSGYTESAQQLAREKNIEELVDLNVFVQCQRIAQSLRHGETKDALQWCNENKTALKKSQYNLEFELRLQQYIEMIRKRDRTKFVDAMVHAKKYLAPYDETQSAEIHRAAGLLAFPPDTKAEPYKSMYASERWIYLSGLFIRTHHELLSLPSRPLIHIALSAGLSALKTPSCHSAYTSSSSNPHSITTSVCPICSTELNQLARNLPYAHHTKSYVENDPIVLPNGRVYGLHRLLDMSKKLSSIEAGKVKDPITGQIYDESDMKKVYIM